MLKFVPQDSEGRPQKRKFTHHACDSCKRKKKRCVHIGDQKSPITVLEDAISGSNEPAQLKDFDIRNVLNNNLAESVDDSDQCPRSGLEQRALFPSVTTMQEVSTSTGPGESSTGPISSNTKPNCDRNLLSLDDQDTRSGRVSDSRFVGDLNPEAIFLATKSPSSEGESVQPADIGVWLSRKPVENPRYYSALPAKTALSRSIYAPDPLTANFLLPHLEEQCLRLLPNNSDFEALRRIYVDDIYPLFPIIDESALRSNETGPVTALLKQAICLSASTSPSAKPYLTFDQKDVAQSLERLDFSRQLALAMQTSINLGILKDRQNIILVLTVLALFTQFSDDHHASAEFTARAVSYVQTIGLHLLGKSNEETSRTRIFLCVWAVDRLDAAFHGRPVLFHERDIGRDLISTISAQESSFQLFLRIILLLDKVIYLYRPTTSVSSNENMIAELSSFEELVEASGALRCSTKILATAETLYHSVVMLSCRTKSTQAPSRSSISHIRQAHSSARATSIVSDELCGQLSFFPFVPYAISLSLRVAYHELRVNKVPMLRMRARRQMLINSSILRELADTYSTCSSLADLAERTIQELDKIIVPAAQQQGSDTDEVQQISAPESVNQLPLANIPAVSSRNSVSHDFDPGLVDLAAFDNVDGLDIFTHLDLAFDLGNLDAPTESEVWR